MGQRVGGAWRGALTWVPVMVAAMTAGVACNSSDEALDKGGGLSADHTVVSVEPAHLTTGNDGSRVEVRGSNPSGSVETAWLKAITLTASSGDGPSPFTRSLEKPSDASFVYDFNPKSPLPGGWYVVILPVPDQGLFIGPSEVGPAPAYLREDGTYKTVFRVGNEPLLLALAACASKDDGTLPKLILSFSEAVVMPEQAPVSVTVNGDLRDCTVYDTSQKATVGLSCSPAPSTDDAITVSIAEGIVAADGGEALHDVAGATRMTIDVPPAAERASCRTWRETRLPTLTQ